MGLCISELLWRCYAVPRGILNMDITTAQDDLAHICWERLHQKCRCDRDAITDILFRAFSAPPHFRILTRDHIGEELDQLLAKPTVDGWLLRVGTEKRLAGVALGVALCDTIEGTPAMFSATDGGLRDIRATFYGHYIALAPAMQGRGLGKSLHYQFLSNLAMDYTTFLAYTPAFNTRAIEVYCRYGAEYVAVDEIELEVRDHGCERIPVLYFEETLPPKEEVLRDCIGLRMNATPRKTTDK